MKKTNEILVCIAFLIAVNAGYSQTIAPPYQVGNWPGFRTAAVSYTFDDGCSNQFAIAIPMFNEFGYKLTMFTITGTTPPPNWTGLKNAASQGHEVASHTVTHPHLGSMTIAQQTTELANSQSVINSHITGSQCVTLAYPFCEPSNQALTSTYYIAARHCQGLTEGNTPGNYYQISSVICGNLGAVQTAADFNSKFAYVASTKGWCVFLIHGIDSDGGYSPLPSAVLRSSLQYLDANRDTFWVSTFSNVVRYIKERNAVTVAELPNQGTSIVLQVTDTLDNAIYNYPLTIRRPLPSGWGTSANVSQNGRKIASSIVDVNSIKYVIFDVVPDSGNIVISKVLYGDSTGSYAGEIAAWGAGQSGQSGDHDRGQCIVPEPNKGFTAIATGGVFSLGLKQDGSIAAWGANYSGQCNVPAPNTGFTAIAAGATHSLGLKQDGSIVAWGSNYSGECNVPLPNSGFKAIAAGGAHSLGLKANGSIVAWGDNYQGDCNVPSPNTGFVAIAAGFRHSLGIKQDGSVAAWGFNGSGQCNVPEPNTGFISIAAGEHHSLGLKGCPFNLDGDLYNDCKVDFYDVAILANNWRVAYDLYDLRTLVADWLIDCIEDSSNPACVQK